MRQASPSVERQKPMRAIRLNPNCRSSRSDLREPPFALMFESEHFLRLQLFWRHTKHSTPYIPDRQTKFHETPAITTG